ncbi:MAG: hypothetical protein J07HQW1_00728 [Haloquadratum walsbyi J07HQW1]|jgi:hypothetical protein|uniref:Uncharacterized protein n=1 Tax=Haloquadratum walsbyi J07HQW1 TaxID=1238424 RepID=U1PF32_9EURY|nr:MAG: hypothetical protein J07HQW1_00728 [Haloquadratum walsbyi J07HQW1]
MYAQSFLGSIRRLRLRSEYLLNQRQLDTDLLTAVGRQYLTTLSAVDALIVEATPFPVLVSEDNDTVSSDSEKSGITTSVSGPIESNQSRLVTTNDPENHPDHESANDREKTKQENSQYKQRNMMITNHIDNTETVVSSHHNPRDDAAATTDSGRSIPSSGRNRGLIATLAFHLSMNGFIRIQSLNETIKQRARQSRRVHTSPLNSQFQIPLTDDGPGAHNWRPVIRTVIDRFETLIPLCEQVLSRLCDGSPESVATQLWKSAVDTLSEMRTVLKIHLAKQERLRRLYNRPSLEPVEFAAQAVTQLTGTNVRTDQ